jgi:hypothetical protein
MYTDDMPSCGIIFLPCSMNFDTGVRTILKFTLSNWNGCNIGIIGENE